MTMNPRPNRQLALEAYDGRPIPNSILVDPSEGAIKLAEMSYRMLLHNVTKLGPPTGRYNCHGLVFACRRTNVGVVGAEVSIDNLLRRDHYEQVSSPQVGDLIIYRHNDQRSIDHSGIVCRLEPLGNQVFVWSMWGGLGEFEHQAGLSPYQDCSMEYWRLKG